MADKTITQIQLRDDVDDDVNFPGDDGIQSYRMTAPQVATYVHQVSRPLATKTANYTLTAADHIILINSVGGGFNLTLPAPTNYVGKTFYIKKISADSLPVTLLPTSGLIEGQSSQVITAPGTSIELKSNGTGWFIF